MYNRFAAIFENLLQLPPHEPSRDGTPQPTEGQLVLDDVVHLHAAFDFAERMRVAPRPEGPALLHVGEQLVLAPAVDARAPADREAEDAQRVIDDVALAQAALRTEHDAEARRRRRDPRQVVGLGEEREDARQRRGDLGRPLEDHFTTGTTSLRIQSGPTRRCSAFVRNAGLFFSYTLWPRNWKIQPRTKSATLSQSGIQAPRK